MHVRLAAIKMSLLIIATIIPYNRTKMEKPHTHSTHTGKKKI